MCKYCKLKDLGRGELHNSENYIILSIKNGNQSMDVMFNRYVDNELNIHDSELILDYGVSLSDSGFYPVKSKAIKIKYCPFCGEKL